MFFKGKHEAARMELRFINKTGNRHFDKPSYIHTHCTYTLRIFDLVAKFTWRAAALGIYEKTDCLKVASAGGVSCGFTTPQTGW